VGDEADTAGPAKELLPIAAQVPDAVPAMPPPSKPDIPAVDVAVPEDVPVTELPPIPKDVCGIEPPMPEHIVTLPVVGPIGDAPDVIGLTPGDASSVAPNGTRVGATGEPGPMPSGEVMPSGAPGEMLIPPTCAKAEPQPKRTAAVVAITKRVIVGSTYSSQSEFGVPIGGTNSPKKLITMHGHHLARIAAICAILRQSSG
jgi:hypothetical protein